MKSLYTQNTVTEWHRDFSTTTGETTSTMIAEVQGQAIEEPRGKRI
jgi:hypothetical protein